jgi:hypothetical protein
MHSSKFSWILPLIVALTASFHYHVSAQSTDLAIMTRKEFSSFDELSKHAKTRRKLACVIGKSEKSQTNCDYIALIIGVQAEYVRGPLPEWGHMVAMGIGDVTFATKSHAETILREVPDLKPVGSLGEPMLISGFEVPSLSKSANVSLPDFVANAEKDRRARDDRERARAEREENEARARPCAAYYPGKVGKISRGGFAATEDSYIVRYVNADLQMVTIEGTSGGNSMKRGEIREFSCQQLRQYSK